MVQVHERARASEPPGPDRGCLRCLRCGLGNLLNIPEPLQDGRGTLITLLHGIDPCSIPACIHYRPQASPPQLRCPKRPPDTAKGLLGVGRGLILG